MGEVLKKRDESEIETVLAEDIDFTGSLSFKDALMIKGRFKGEIKAEGDLYIGEKAEVEAKIEARMVTSHGRIKGNIEAKARIELFATAEMAGDITCPDLIIESGAIYNGKCTMQRNSGAKQ